MKNKYLYIETFGCQMNVHDSGQMAVLLRDLGYEPTEDSAKADCILINTCSIREKAEQKAMSELGRLMKLKEKNPNLIVGFAGCLAQHLGARVHGRVKNVDLVFGTHNIHRLPEMMARVQKERKPVTEVGFSSSLHSLGIFAPPPKGAVGAFVSIMQGCDNYCAYCVVPFLRGPEMSREPKDIVGEIEKLAGRGIREVTLLGQNVNSYGKKTGGRGDFVFLLKKINDIEGIERIRFTTSHPRDLSEELISCFGSLRKLCRHIHLPVQSGSSRILKRMNRGYTAEEYLEKVARLRRVCPEISITSDIIVGFPGETQKDYQETIDMMEKIRFDSVFSFKYSERKGTAAQAIEGKVPETEKKLRLREVQALQDRHTQEKNTSLEGSVQEVLVEGQSRNSRQDMTGRTSSWKIVNFEGRSELIGRTVPVRISRGYLHSLRGKQITP
ncbi:MAG: tRNA (N6-isopentenyl adenosine(37)-C2)-methylthiotransferase MiaB [Smithellaceae bacterium]|nr:tRNA (N6-isopentenyl adenosine(37)-C2)-methylthiotransferase MiaB [Smithellaceae bacterium]MDD3848549.1 tRNA (N6-isopentenyl adenosine(37)-C2)-methylthiotransferase MiaB [Smithellaceae bacterium]HOG12882.1 tRNA (N6-isopentenyl adenosine(37)-C2)-methylthiotransferase MiaB [Smithellaceae bacterium]HOQ72366.1 tRNA (N6-isopentenyl adenosine(37)-C2)-methylthiotransferase MiaB [Smithellaceae bacterium]HPL10447.1 tRNA (N6-isopentenyl adenosine(37)-C2)-methylthiotransferase MiaB [Smithellaceae bacte